MPKATVIGNDEVGYLDDGAPIDPALLQALANDMAFLLPSGQLTTRVAVLTEMAGIKAAIRTWYDKQPDQVLREASAYSARCTELWTELRLLESQDREWTQLRTMQVQPVLDEIDRQYKFQTSRIAIARQDLELMKAT
jgi:hypothetical protein